MRKVKCINSENGIYGKIQAGKEYLIDDTPAKINGTYFTNVYSNNEWIGVFDLTNFQYGVCE